MKKLFYLSTCVLLALAAYSCDNDEETPTDYTPTITNLTQSIAEPTAVDAVTISAIVTTPAGSVLNLVELRWSLDGVGQTAIAMSKNGDTYSGTIEKQAAGANVEYTIMAANDQHATAKESGSYTVGAIDFSLLKLNEINGNGADTDKYIELYNNSTKAIPLENVKIYYNNASSEPEITWTGDASHIIQPKSFLLLKGTKGSGDLIKGLSGTQGIVVELQDPSGNTLDIFRVGADENRANSYSRIPDGTGDWYYTDVAGTQGATNGTITAGLTKIRILPSISNVKRDITKPSPSQAVTISATVVSNFGTTTSSVKLKWSVNSAAQNDITMTASGDVYTATIPAQANQTEVTYSIDAANENGTATSASYSYTVEVSNIDYNVLVINEVDGNGKFIEIYNKSTETISLEDVILIKFANDTTTWWTGGETATIAGKGYYTIVQSGQATEGGSEYTGNGGISPKKTVKFELRKPNGELIDTFARLKPGDNTLDSSCTPDYGKAPIYSFSRCPDGTGDFGLATPSCNKANPTTSAGAIETN